MKRKLFRLSALVVLLTASAAAGQQAPGKSIEWHNYKDGMARGKFEKKKVFLHFYADWCVYCKEMAKTTFADPAVIDALNQNFIPVRVNTDLDPDTAALYGVNPLPDTWFIDENGGPIGNRPGFISADQMKVLLKLVQSEPATVR